MAKRYVLEGEWSGYRSSQQRVCHREVITEERARNFKLATIQYTDNTTLRVSVRPAEYRERVKTLFSYCSLIRDAERLGKSFVTVDELIALEQKANTPTPSASS